MPPFIADFHIHSPFSRATSKDLSFETLFAHGKRKGVSLIGTGDCTHPGWIAEIQKKLAPDGQGFFKLKSEKEATALLPLPPNAPDKIRFVLTGEISCIYSYGGKTRKVHCVVMMPDLDSVLRLNQRLAAIGNIKSDGRPILGLDARNLLEIVLECSPEGVMIPAHIWTPWFSVLGSKSGFDSIEECFRDLTNHIFALETGLSSDPAMNWQVSSLDRFALVSNSDAHSPSKIGREANLFNCDMSWPSVMDALKGIDKKGFSGTVEFFPEEGKYHADGHRDCKISFLPEETRRHKGLCPVCGRGLTLGVLYRVEELKDRSAGIKPERAKPYFSFFSLKQLIGQLEECGPESKKVNKRYEEVLFRLGPELTILLSIPLAEIDHQCGQELSQAIGLMRTGKVSAIPGFDGEFGKITLGK